MNFENKENEEMKIIEDLIKQIRKKNFKERYSEYVSVIELQAEGAYDSLYGVLEICKITNKVIQDMELKTSLDYENAALLTTGINTIINLANAEIQIRASKTEFKEHQL